LSGKVSLGVRGEKRLNTTALEDGYLMLNTSKNPPFYSFTTHTGKVRENVKLSLCFFLTEYHAIKAYWGVEL
jgi:hypothetical protein